MAYLPTFWLRCVANVRKYTIHGSYGYCCVSSFSTAAWLAFSNKREPPEVFIKDSKRAWVFNLDILQRVDRTSGFPKTNETKKPESNSIRGFWRFTTKYEKNFVDVVFSGYYTFIILKKNAFSFFSLLINPIFGMETISTLAQKKKKTCFPLVWPATTRVPGGKVLNCQGALAELRQNLGLLFLLAPQKWTKSHQGFFFNRKMWPGFFHDLFMPCYKWMVIYEFIWCFVKISVLNVCLVSALVVSGVHPASIC